MTALLRQHAASAFAVLFALAGFAGASGPARAITYHGTPDLKLTVDMVTAGTGTNGYDTKQLFAAMYGARMPGEAHRLTAMYGPAAVANFFTLMNFTVADVLRMVKRDNVTLPAADSPIVPQRLDNSIAEAGLVAEGPRAGQYDVGYMIEHLISNHYHHELMMDLVRKYPRREVASFHSVLGTVVKDSAPQVVSDH
ncbi:MAG: hypothetical protein M3R44_05125 [Candidatus Eremiobacteraeota bacterium]|nr:hypothetical protein [Candidatus Eremiobacteraeota bacterium]